MPSLSFLPDMPSSTTPGSSSILKFQCRDVDFGLHRVLIGSALPRLPQIRFTRVYHFEVSVVRTLLRPTSLLAPLNGPDRIAPAIGGRPLKRRGFFIALRDPCLDGSHKFGDALEDAAPEES